LSTINPSQEARLESMKRVITYTPLAATVLVLIIQNFFPSFFNDLSFQITSAIIASCTVCLVWHVETHLTKSTQSLGGLETRIHTLETTQETFIQSVKSLKQMQLGEAFSVIAKTSPRVEHLRIFAISSLQILSFFKFNDIRADKCQILLRGFEENDTDHQDFLNQIKLICSDWQYLHKTNRILELEIRHYDFLPTEYEVIFDNEYLIFGLYDSDPTDYSGVSVRNPVLVDSKTDAGRIMVSEFANRFDNLFKTCETHHGPCTLATPSKPAANPQQGTDSDKANQG